MGNGDFGCASRFKRTSYQSIYYCWILFCGFYCNWVYAQSEAAYDSATDTNIQTLNIIRITPTGDDVPAGKQIVFTFNQAVVPIGRMERDQREIPISIIPKVNCQWRWVNTSSLACQLNEQDKLLAATKYSIKIRAGIRSDKGSVMQNDRTHSFITARPKVRYSRFETWRAPGHPVIRLTFDQPVSKESVEKYIFLSYVDQSKVRGSVSAQPYKHDRETPMLLPMPGEPLTFINLQSNKGMKVDEQATMVAGRQARRIWSIQPLKEMPLNTSVKLQVEPGLRSALGLELGVENRVIVEFDTFPEFTFLGVNCFNSSSKKNILLPPLHLTTKQLNVELQDKCDPLKRVSLAFSAPVIKDEVKHHVTVNPDLAGGRKDYDPWENSYAYSSLRRAHKANRHYYVEFPERLKAFQRYELRSHHEQFKDEFGRTLPTSIDMVFMTDHRAPDIRINHTKAVLEKQLATEVPLYVTNLNSISTTHKKVTQAESGINASAQLSVADAEDIAYAMPLGVRDMLNGKSGVVSGVIDTRPQVESYRERRFFAQVTPFQVHAKIGHFNSLIWVTELATGKSVRDAKVSIYVDDYVQLNGHGTVLTTGKTGKDGTSVLDGTAIIDPQLDYLKSWYRNDGEPRFFIRVEKGEEIALLPLDNHFAVRSSGAWSLNKKLDGHMFAWGTTAQGVYKVGDLIQYKFYVRNHNNKQWVKPANTLYRLEIVDPMGKVVEEIKQLWLSEFGSYDGEFAVSATAVTGWYQFRLHYTQPQEAENPSLATKKIPAKLILTPMRVLVSDFTPSPFKVGTSLNGDRFSANDQVEIDTSAKLHAGGPYADAETRVTARLKETLFSSQHAQARGFRFNDSQYRHFRDLVVHQAVLNVDANGEATNSFSMPDKGIHFGKLSVESAVRDDRGKYIANSATATYVGLDRFVGLKNTQWTYQEDQRSLIKYLVVDDSGQPVAGTKVDIKIQHEQTKASRVKGAGNAYLTHYVKQWVDVGQCNAISILQSGDCEFTPQDPGSFRFIANIKDTNDRTHSVTLYTWVVGKGRVVWQSANENSVEIIPEQKEYKIGNVAKYLIKNPYPGATALVSIERYGVIEQWTQILDGSTPVVEVPIKADYFPGFYLSVLINSPRVEKPMDNNVDLGKPTFKMGYVTVPVRDTYKEIEINIKTDRDVFKPRETVKATIKTKARHPKKGDKFELAVVAIDEAVFDLNTKGKAYYDPYAGFNHLDNLDLNNYSLLTRLIGRQNFEKKGANPGGGGSEGAAYSIRDIIKYVSYWNPSIKLDKSNKTQIEFELPDNLTAWRIFVLAVSADDRMGLGDARIKVNRPTELRPVMPNQVSEGDEFVAGFSVMNRTDQTRELNVTVQAAGDALQHDQAEFKTQLAIRLAPFKRETVWLPIKTHKPGEISFLAVAGDAIDKDAISHNLPVHKRRSLHTAANYGTTTQASVIERMQFPDNIYPDVGGISIVTSPSVIGSVSGAFKYIYDYPYHCWEQRLSKAVMASHYVNLQVYMPDTFEWPDAKDMPQAMLEIAKNYQAPNGGMAYWIPNDQYVSPYLSAYTALAFNWLRNSGYQVPAEVEHRLQGYLLGLLKRDTFPSFFSAGMASSVRAVALAALVEQDKISLTDLMRYQRVVPQMDLFGKAHYLTAAAQLDGAEQLVIETANSIIAHSNQTGGKFSFNEIWDDSYRRILATPLRSNCAILSSLLKSSAVADAHALVADIPFKQVRSITQSRKNRSHWENTQENIFCMNALIEYSRVYESTKPDMRVTASIEGRSLGETRFDDLRDEAVVFKDPMTNTKPGLKTQINISKIGAGRLYYSTRMSYAPTISHSERVNSGIDIRREYSVEREGNMQLLTSPMHIKRGDLVRVDIYLSLPTARHFVVVDDPVPGGLEPVNRDLATASGVDADKGEFKAAGGSWWFQYSDWSYYGASYWSFYHKELRHHAVRFYSDYLPAGNYHLSYTAQAISEGAFSVLPVHTEEMYDPDVFGKGLPALLEVTR